MEITREYLEKEVQKYEQAALQLRSDAIANQGAADALKNILAQMGKGELTTPPPTDA